MPTSLGGHQIPQPILKGDPRGLIEPPTFQRGNAPLNLEGFRPTLLPFGEIRHRLWISKVSRVPGFDYAEVESSGKRGIPRLLELLPFALIYLMPRGVLLKDQWIYILEALSDPIPIEGIQQGACKIVSLGVGDAH